MDPSRNQPYSPSLKGGEAAQRPGWLVICPRRARLSLKPTCARSSPLPSAQRIHDEFEMCDLDVAFTRCTHDVIKYRCEFQDLEPKFSQVAITANVSVAEAEHMPEFMRERPRRQIAGCESDVSADETVRGLS